MLLGKLGDDLFAHAVQSNDAGIEDHDPDPAAKECSGGGDNENRRAGFLDLLQCNTERTLSHLIEVGIGLVQHDQTRAAINRSGQTNTLALTTGQVDTFAADNGV